MALGLLLLTWGGAIVPGRAAAGPAGVSGRALLEGMAAVADRYAQATWAQTKYEESVTWSSWALLYRGQERGVPASVTGQQLALVAARASRQYAQQSAQLGNAPLARLYSASAAFWQDLYQQLARGARPLRVRFPAEMATPIKDAPGTPWAAWGETKLPGAGGTAGLPAGGSPMGRPTANRGAPSPAAQRAICPACGGAGRSVCFTCKGTGEENYQAFANFYGLSDDAAESLARRTRHTCTDCGGSGFKTCIYCGGTGRLGGR
jgi:hypothetical protein